MMTTLRHLALVLAALLAAAPALAFETGARGAYVIDVTTGTVLLNKNADQPLPPASMSKLMTLYVAFEAVRDELWRLDDVSQHPRPGARRGSVARDHRALGQ
jgi:D-alanyl-D-alanine carboxypeptidase (penicillin-binding protein 5/6)